MGARELSYHFPFLQGYKEINSVNTGLPNRHESTNEYRYGYQGSEKDDEVKGEGDSYTTTFRQLDPRVGRWLSIDPKATAWESPYVSMGDNPVWYNDPKGDYKIKVKLSKELKQSLKSDAKNSDTKNWRKEYRQSVINKKNELHDFAVKRIIEGRKAVESSDDKLKAFKIITGANKGDERWNDFFTENGKGPKIIVNDNYSMSGGTSPRGKHNITIGTKRSAGHTNQSFTQTYIHELAHYSSFKYGIVRDNTIYGYPELSMSLDEQLQTLQTAIDLVNNKYKSLIINVYTKQGDYDETRKKVLEVEGGYLLEQIIFGSIVHRPIMAK